MDLLDLGTPTTASPAVNDNDPTDLLGDMFSDMNTKVSAPKKSKPAPSQQSAATDLLGDLFGGSSEPQNTASSGGAMGGGDERDLLGSMTSTSATSSNMMALGGGSGVYGFAALKSQLGAKVNAFSRSHETDFVVHANSTLQISYFTVFKQQKSTLCLFVSNLSGGGLSNIEIAVKTDNPG